ncbi:unnamed protein product [Symbiodinium sp. KB8]|nr:unnamed protein product [Symbiodinium sp. KB8]
MGDAFKRLVVRTLAQLLHEEFQSACALFQYALSTQAGAEALVRATCASTDRTTVLSVEGVGAYDHFSRQSMLSALVDRPALAGLLPYAALFYGSPSTYVFYDAEGHAHASIKRCSRPCRARLHPSSTLYAFLDDIYVTGPPEHTVGQFAIVREAVARHANIQVHLGKTRAWNSAAAGGEPPRLLEVLPPHDPENPCWTGNWALPAAQQGAVVLRSPVGSRDFIAAKLAQRRSRTACCYASHECLNLQSAWLLLLYYAAPRSPYLLRTLPPADTADFAAEHDAAIRCCLATLLAGGDGDMPLPDLSYRRAQLPLSMGGLGLGSAERLRHAAYWISWAGTVRALRKHQPSVLAALFRRSEGFSAPTWARLLEEDAAAPDQRHAQHDPLQVDDRAGNARYRKPSTSALEMLSLTMQRAALSRPSHRAPTHGCRTRSTESRKLRLPLPLAPKRCPCGGRLHEYGDRRSACAQVARICKEAGARIASHVALRGLNLDVPAGDGRSIEVVANAPFGRALRSVDATIVSPVRRDGRPRPRADHQPGLAHDQAVDGGRVSRGTLTFLRLLARARARQRAPRSPWCAAAAR